MIVAGMQSSGKTVFIHSLIKQREEILSEPIRKVYYHYAIWQQTFADQSDPNVHYVQGVPNVDEIPNDCLLILDDLLGQMGNDKNLLDLFCVKSHHKSISTIFVTQSFFFESKIFRCVTRNAHYIVLFRSQRMVANIQQLSRQLWPKHPGFLSDAYDKATKGRPYSYLFLNTHPSADEKMAVMTNILPSEGYTRVFQIVKINS